MPDRITKKWRDRLNPLRLLRRKRPRPESLLNIGLDFGTSSSKVFIRDIHAGQAYAYAHANAVDGFGPFCWPSAVCVSGGQLFFGDEAETASSGTVIRSFKTCIACQCGSPGPRKCESAECTLDGRRGFFRVKTGRQHRIALGATEVSALYLGSLLTKLEAELEGRPPFEPPYQLTYNVAAPLDMVDELGLSHAFELVLYRAARLKGRIRQGIHVDEAKMLLDAESRSAPALPPEAERPTYVIPETHAAMVGYVISGKAEEGLYALVDVGAGTTDVAVFRYASARAERDVAYYFASTEVIGADDIDRELVSLASSALSIPPLRARELLPLVRLAKQAVTESGMHVRGYALPADQIRAAVSPVCDGIYTHYRRTWARGYCKEKRPQRWRRMTVLLAGGGNQFPFVSERFTAKPCHGMGSTIIHELPVVHVGVPDGISVLGRARRPDISQYADLLTVAHGLSFHRAENPQYFLPHEVDPIPDPRETEKREIPWEPG